MPHSRPMPGITAGVNVLRVSGTDGTYWIFYYFGLSNGVLVFLAFAKKTRQTPQSEIKVAMQRLKELLNA